MRLKHGLLNTFEQGLNRVADAATTIALVRYLSPETFSKLGLAQAAVAPLLLLFISPEAVLYRDFAKWKQGAPAELIARLKALRFFGWGKLQAAFFLSLVAAALHSGESYWNRFFALIWAFSLALAPQISGADREYLRLDLRLKQLNAITLTQKLLLLLGTIWVVLFRPTEIAYLALVALSSALVGAFMAHAFVKKALPQGGSGTFLITQRQVISEAIGSFSIWRHLSGVITNWVQTLDLFFLGFVFRFPARLIGLYSAALKIGNFSNALPMALANSISVWIAQGEAKDQNSEILRLKKTGFYFTVLCVVQGMVFWLLLPLLTNSIGSLHQTVEEAAEMVVWMRWILVGNSLLCCTYPVTSWIAQRGFITTLFWKVQLPWVLLTALTYGIGAWKWGAQGAAVGNSIVAVLYLFLVVRVTKAVTTTQKI